MGLLSFLVAKVPKSKSFVSGSCDQNRAIGVESHVEDSLGMTGQGSNLVEVLHVPNVDLIVRKPMAGYDLIFPLGEQNRTNLTLCLLLLNQLLFVHIPEPNAPIGSSSSGSNQIRLIW